MAVPDLRELSRDRAFTDDLGVTANIRGAGRSGSELVQVRDPAHVLDLARGLERLPQG
jgi:hypothetical protein